MTEEEAKIIIFEVLLIEARDTISFLHHCLKSPNYKYDHPEQTAGLVNRINKAVPYKAPCFHSMRQDDCQECQEEIIALKKLAEASKMFKDLYEF